MRFLSDYSRAAKILLTSGLHPTAQLLLGRNRDLATHEGSTLDDQDHALVIRSNPSDRPRVKKSERGASRRGTCGAWLSDSTPHSPRNGSRKGFFGF